VISLEMAEALSATEENARPPASQLESREHHDRAWFLYLPFAVALVLTFGHTPDDPLITLRYAANVLHGQGLVFNVGEHVQGFSSPLHLLVSMAVAVPGGYSLFLAKLVSVGFAVLAVREGARLVAGLGLARWATRLGYLALGTSFVFAMAAVNGLETSLAALLTVLLVRMLVEGDGVVAPGRSGLVACALVLTRPEGIALVVGLAIVSLALERSVVVVRRLVWASGALVGVAVLAGFGLLVFGDALPNTYYAKAQPLVRALTSGLSYLQGSLGLPDVLTAVLCVLVAIGVAVVVTRRRRLGYAVAVVGMQLLFVLRAGGDWMLGGRFVAPVIIPALVVTLLGVVAVAGWSARVSWSVRTAATVIGVVLGVVAVVSPFVAGAVPAWSSNGRVDDGALIASGGYAEFSTYWAALPTLVACVPHGGSVATTEVGNLGFARRDLRIVDLRGLTDDVIALQAPASAKHSWGVALTGWSNRGSVLGRRILEQHPDVIVLLDSKLTPELALGGAYRRAAVTTIAGDLRADIYTPTAGPSTCGAS
jgi:hypothetical protein